MFHHLYCYSPSWYCFRYRGSIPCSFRSTRLRVRLTPIVPVVYNVLRSPVALYPLTLFSSSAGRTHLVLPSLFKALTISTHENSQTLTKQVPFASVFPLLKWKQVMRLTSLLSLLASQVFSMRILIQVFPSTLLPAFIGSDLLATTEPSAISQTLGLAFPFRVIPFLPCSRSRQGDYETSLGHLHLLFHPS